RGTPPPVLSHAEHRRGSRRAPRGRRSPPRPRRARRAGRADRLPASPRLPRRARRAGHAARRRGRWGLPGDLQASRHRLPGAQGTAATYQRLFDLPEVEVNGGPRTMLGWAGGGTLLMVPAGEVGGMEGMVALSMVAPDMPPLVDRLERAGAATLIGAGEITVEPRSSHGVHLHISRYHFP